jgi:hypothetical protein
LLLSIQQGGHRAEGLAHFGALSGRFSELHEVPLERVQKRGKPWQLSSSLGEVTSEK